MGDVRRGRNERCWFNWTYTESKSDNGQARQARHASTVIHNGGMHLLWCNVRNDEWRTHACTTELSCRNADKGTDSVNCYSSAAWTIQGLCPWEGELGLATLRVSHPMYRLAKEIKNNWKRKPHLFTLTSESVGETLLIDWGVMRINCLPRDPRANLIYQEH